MTKIHHLIEKINGGNHPLFHELYGTDAIILKEQASRYASLLGEFEKTYGSSEVS
ncbi:MAG: galactokinase, partial [Bacteroidia bacterium]|nr:galactokinase [Bacteroidia bacterium]